jgi:hypothetical protein
MSGADGDRTRNLLVANQPKVHAEITVFLEEYRNFTPQTDYCKSAQTISITLGK